VRPAASLPASAGPRQTKSPSRILDLGLFVLVGWLVGRLGPHDGIVRLDDGLPGRYPNGRTLSWLKGKQPRYREGERGLGGDRQSPFPCRAFLV
jgi:hypothetical protein